MNNNRPHVYANPEAAAEACSSFILKKLEQAVEERGRASIAVSGGRTPELLFENLRRANFPWALLQFFFVDERAAPPDNAESNFHLANVHFLAPVTFPAANIHRIEGEIETGRAAAKYAANIRETFGIGSSDIPAFDVIHHGLGPDAHTASLFPGEPLLDDRVGIAAAVRADTPPHDRVTLLPGVLLVSRTTVFLVDGADKQTSLENVLIGELDVKRYPAQLLARSGKTVDWFLAGLNWPIKGDTR